MTHDYHLRLSLSNNDLSSRWLQHDVFSHLHSLKHLQLSSNRSGSSSSYLTSPNNCRLTSLGSLVSSLPSLTSLHAANNQINQINDLAGLQELVKHFSSFVKNPSKLMNHWKFMPARLTSISSIFSFSSDNFCSPFSYCQLNVNLLRRISTCPTTRSRTSARWTPPPPSAPSTSRTTASTTSGEIITSVL